MTADHTTTPATPAEMEDPWRGLPLLEAEHREQFRNDPYPALNRLREIDPVNETPIGIWRLTRYADVMRLLREVKCGVRTTDGILPGVDESDPTTQRYFMLQQDPPTHTRLRRLVSRAFTPRAVERIRQSIERHGSHFLDRLFSKKEQSTATSTRILPPILLEDSQQKKRLQKP